MNRLLAICAMSALAAALLAGSARGGQNTNDGDLVGLDDLLARVGAANLPTGNGVLAGHVEFGDAEGDYGPNQALNQYVGKTFIANSGPTGTNAHANNVGFNYYGNTFSIAPGITTINLWEASAWITTGFLRSNTGLSPVTVPAGLKIINHSWLAAFATNTQNNNALRRGDFVMNRDDLLMMVGVDNDESGVPNDDLNVPLFNHVYNGISVGVTDGSHMNDATLAGIDGTGRMSPVIVAPGTKTSWATPVVAAGAALMIDTARSIPALADNPAAERGEVIKAILLAAANHRAGWTNNPVLSGPDRGITSQPLDDVYGADTLDVNVSHLVLTGGEHDGAASVPTAANAPHAGWDLVSVGLGESRYWRMSICQLAAEVSFLVTWHRQVQSPFGNANWAVADFDLILWRVDGQGKTVTLVGDAGLPWFAEGNVVSQSAVDNIEHVFVRELAAGDYVLELRRLDGLASYPSWDAAVAWTGPPSTLVGDIDGDCVVGITDFLDLLGNWGPCPCPPACPADLDGDCEVGITDFLLLLGNWG
jgi:hypothetical protein